MSNGTLTRPILPQGGRPGKPPDGVSEQRNKGCGAWFVMFIPFPPRLVSGREQIRRPDKSTETRRRWSLDNVVYFYPNLRNDCKNYGFIQFVKRTSHKTNAAGENHEPEPRYTHEWQPDVEGWGERKTKKYTDLGEIIYDGGRVHKVSPKGLSREDGPGLAHPWGRPPKNLRIAWEFKLYVVCDDGAKAVGLLEFGFGIHFDSQGRPSLEFPAAGEDGHPKLHEYCCQGNDDYFEWIDQWHYHPKLSELPRDDEQRKKELRQARYVVDQSIRSRRSLISLTDVDSIDPPQEQTILWTVADPGLRGRYMNVFFVADDETDEAEGRCNEGEKEE